MYVAIVEVKYYLSLPFDLPTGDLYCDRFTVASDDDDYDKFSAIALQKLLDKILRNHIDYIANEIADNPKLSADKTLYDLVRGMVSISSYVIYDLECDTVLEELH